MLSMKPKYWDSWRGEVLRAIVHDGAQDWNDIKEKTGFPQRKLRAVLDDLMQHGIIGETGENQYKLTSNDLYKAYQSAKGSGEKNISPTTKSTNQDNVRKRVLGVLKSFPRISISDLAKYSGESEDATRDMLFEMIGDNLVSGRFDPAADEFISAHAASASRAIKSTDPTLAKCMYCGKSLERALISGDEVACPSCGMVNVG